MSVVVRSLHLHGRVRDERTIMTLMTAHTPSPTISHGTVTAKPVTTTLWRVSASDDRVLGHVRLVESKFGERYAATLILPGGIRTMALGEFWSLRDALDCFL